MMDLAEWWVSCAENQVDYMEEYEMSELLYVCFAQRLVIYN
jgi:hypothetical protein